jgi:hypothetical protein
MFSRLFGNHKQTRRQKRTQSTTNRRRRRRSDKAKRDGFSIPSTPSHSVLESVLDAYESIDISLESDIFDTTNCQQSTPKHYQIVRKPLPRRPATTTTAVTVTKSTTTRRPSIIEKATTTSQPEMTQKRHQSGKMRVIQHPKIYAPQSNSSQEKFVSISTTLCKNRCRVRARREQPRKSITTSSGLHKKKNKKKNKTSSVTVAVSTKSSSSVSGSASPSAAGSNPGSSSSSLCSSASSSWRHEALKSRLALKAGMFVSNTVAASQSSEAASDDETTTPTSPYAKASSRRSQSTVPPQRQQQLHQDQAGTSDASRIPTSAPALGGGSHYRDAYSPSISASIRVSVPKTAVPQAGRASPIMPRRGSGRKRWNRKFLDLQLAPVVHVPQGIEPSPPSPTYQVSPSISGVSVTVTASHSRSHSFSRSGPHHSLTSLQMEDSTTQFPQQQDELSYSPPLQHMKESLITNTAPTKRNRFGRGFISAVPSFEAGDGVSLSEHVQQPEQYLQAYEKPHYEESARTHILNLS